jgi:methyl-accepting chemotaxis protein
MRTIADMDRTTARVAAAVEQQGAATRAIAQNAESAAEGTAAAAATIRSVQDATAKTGTAATEMLNAAKLLSREADGLTTKVADFTSQARAG